MKLGITPAGGGILGISFRLRGIELVGAAAISRLKANVHLTIEK